MRSFRRRAGLHLENVELTPRQRAVSTTKFERRSASSPPAFAAVIRRIRFSRTTAPRRAPPPRRSRVTLLSQWGATLRPPEIPHRGDRHLRRVMLYSAIPHISSGPEIARASFSIRAPTLSTSAVTPRTQILVGHSWDRTDAPCGATPGSDRIRGRRLYHDSRCRRHAAGSESRTA
jgi:hypothetical protein